MEAKKRLLEINLHYQNLKLKQKAEEQYEYGWNLCLEDVL